MTCARITLGIVALLVASHVHADNPVAPEQTTPRFRDAADGWLDASEFLDTAYGFVPILAPITEPAVGYGAAGALVFIDRNASTEGQQYVRPNIAVIGGLATENGTRGMFGGHIGTWREGRLRTLAAVADADVNLEYFGLGGERPEIGAGTGYAIAARGGVAGGSYRLGDFPIWFGMRYVRANTRVSLDEPVTGPEVEPRDLDLELAALTPSLTLDLRNNFFTPTKGWYIDLSVPVFRKDLGGDRDFEKLNLQAMHYRPWTDSLFLAIRGGIKTSSDDTPFFLRPFVWLRGVQALRYQGERAADVELELRWQFHPRFSLVGFGGVGSVRSDIAGHEIGETVTAGGGGFRYLMARRHGLHMGIDFAMGPDDPVIYVVFGSAWLRP